MNVTLPRTLSVLVLGVALLGGCSGAAPAAEPQPGQGSSDSAGSGPSDQQFPDIVEVAVERAADGTYTFDVTVSSPYDTAERYADGWRVLGPDGEVYGEHELTHDHAAEQPFTRTQSGVGVPEGVASVTVEGRDQQNGYGGDTAEVELPTS